MPSGIEHEVNTGADVLYLFAKFIPDYVKIIIIIKQSKAY